MQPELDLMREKQAVLDNTVALIRGDVPPLTDPLGLRPRCRVGVVANLDIEVPLVGFTLDRSGSYDTLYFPVESDIAADTTYVVQSNGRIPLQDIAFDWQYNSRLLGIIHESARIVALDDAKEILGGGWFGSQRFQVFHEGRAILLEHGEQKRFHRELLDRTRDALSEASQHFNSSPFLPYITRAEQILLSVMNANRRGVRREEKKDGTLLAFPGVILDSLE